MNGARIRALLAADLRLQYRNGIYLAYGVVIAFYLALLIGARAHLPDWAVGMIIYSDPAALGFFFLGALMMLERGENVRGALAATPVSGGEYFLSKVVTLTGLTILACVILLAAHGAGNAPLLLIATTLTALCYLGLGVPVALRFRTVNAYLIGSAAWLTPLLLPSGLALLDPFPAWAVVWPPVAQFRLILVATGYGTAGPTDLAVMLAVCALAAVLTCAWALRALAGVFGK